MDIDYQVHIREKDSTLVRVFFALLLMEQLELDWKKCIIPPQELIEWIREHDRKE